MKSLKECIELAVKTKTQRSFTSDFTINVENEDWQVYEVTISNRDILCFCEQGVATFLVDSYGNRHYAELFDWEK